MDPTLSSSQDIGPFRAMLAERLRIHQSSLTDAVLMRISTTESGAYASRIPTDRRIEVCAAVAYGIQAVETGGGDPVPVPEQLLDGARSAARNGVPITSLTKHYIAGQGVFTDCLLDHVDRHQAPYALLQRVLRSQAGAFESLIAAVTTEHQQETAQRNASPITRRTQFVRRLLAGELADFAEFAYDFSQHHLGVVTDITCGREFAAKSIRLVAERLGLQTLIVDGQSNECWAWFAASTPTPLRKLAVTRWPPEIALALGRAGLGETGWRTTHQQARLAYSTLPGSTSKVAQYDEVALIASIAQDNMLVTALHDDYLAPLNTARNNGATLKETLTAYFGSDRNISSTSHRLGVSRQTVTNRLRTVERRLDRRLTSCGTELELALKLECHLALRWPAARSSAN